MYLKHKIVRKNPIGSLTFFTESLKTQFWLLSPPSLDQNITFIRPNKKIKVMNIKEDI